MEPITYDAVVRPDGDRCTGYMAISSTRYADAVTITGWSWTGYGDTPEAALAALEQRLQELHTEECQPRRIVYEIGEKAPCS